MSHSGSPKSSKARRWAGRAGLAVGVPVAFFALLEGGLRLGGYGKPSSFLIPDDLPGYYRTNPDFVSLFLPGSFDLRALNWRVAKEKPANALRVVLLGGSAAQGVPAPTFGMAEMLRAQLRERYPGRKVEVLNAGIVAINSHVVDQIMKDLVPIKPDIVVVYMGNNEVVGPYGPGCAYLSSMPPLWVIRTSVWVRSLRTGQLLGSFMARFAPTGTGRAQWGGMSMFVHNAVAGDDPRLETVYQNFQENLRDIIDTAADCGAKVVVSTVASNLKDCPPFLSLHAPGLTGVALEAWTAAFERGLAAWKLGDEAEARPDLEKALSLDPHYADTLYMLGRMDEGSDLAKARSEYIEASHWDALRFRPDQTINETIRRIAAYAGPRVALADEAMVLGSDSDSTGPIAGHAEFWEHVHLTLVGNSRVAADMADAIGRFLPQSGVPPGNIEASIGYGPHESLPVLERIEVLVKKPPFTNQISYPEEQAWYARQIEQARRLRAGLASSGGKASSGLESSRQRLAEAIQADPDNPLLAGLMEGVDLDMGDFEGALREAHRAEAALPWDFGAQADIASILLRMGKTDEALATLNHAAHSSGDMDQLAPAYVDFYARTKRFDDGVAFLDKALLAQAGDHRLALARASLLAAKGDLPGAEAGFRDLLEKDPSNDEAQEGLVGAFLQAGDAAGAKAQTLAAAPQQESNQANDLRAAKYYDSTGDFENTAHYLSAAERSGPVNSTVELTLALKDYQLHRMDDVLLHLADARLMAQGEGNPQTSAGIDNLIDRMKAEAGYR